MHVSPKQILNITFIQQAVTWAILATITLHSTRHWKEAYRILLISKLRKNNKKSHNNKKKSITTIIFTAKKCMDVSMYINKQYSVCGSCRLCIYVWMLTVEWFVIALLSLFLIFLFIFCCTGTSHLTTSSTYNLLTKLSLKQAMPARLSTTNRHAITSDIFFLFLLLSLFVLKHVHTNKVYYVIYSVYIWQLT